MNHHLKLLALPAAVLLAASASAQYSLTVLHNNDGESRLDSYSSAQPNYGGVAHFAALLDTTRSFYEAAGHGVVSIFAGDTFLAGSRFQASLDSGAPGSRTFYDALAISRIGYDASIIGNHEFDFGPQVLAEFIGDAQTTNPTTYLSANLNFSAEPSLQALVTAGTIAPSKIVTVPTSAGNRTVGIIGVTTDNLPFISSPGGVVVNPVAAAVNTQIGILQAANVDHIIVGSHLQGLATDNSFVSQLNPGVDLIVAGGGDEILRNASAPAAGAGAPATVITTGLIPGDSAVALPAPFPANTYPLFSTTTDTGGNPVPIVTTGGNYGYLGRVTLNFDASGNLVGFGPDSNPQRVAQPASGQADAVTPVQAIIDESVTPVTNFVSGLGSQILAQTGTQFLHGGSSTIRSRQTNLGALVADGILDAAQERAAAFGVDSPQIALVNGGGIRANIPAGNVSRLSTFDVSPFGNFVAVVEDVRAADLKLLLENAFSRTSDGPTPGLDVVGGDGRFAQLAGLSVRYDLSRPGLAFNSAGVSTNPLGGNRVLDITIGSTPILVEGVWQVDPVAFTVDIATLNFSANGGDQWFRTAIGGSSTYLSQLYAFTSLGLTDQNALQEYVLELAGTNPSDISAAAADYQVQSTFFGSRINVIPEPSTVALLAGLAGLGVALLRRRRA